MATGFLFKKNIFPRRKSRGRNDAPRLLLIDASDANFDLHSAGEKSGPPRLCWVTVIA